eukprot:PRCOL_00007262-RA
MARGLSRDQSREKNLKKQAAKGKGKSDENKNLTPAQVRERCDAAKANADPAALAAEEARKKKLKEEKKHRQLAGTQAGKAHLKATGQLYK